MNLHDQIMNLSCGVDTSWVGPGAYKAGHLEGRHRAALLAIEADVAMEVACKHAARQAAQIREQRELIEQLDEALKLAYRHLNGGRDSLTTMEFDRAFKLARAALSAVREYSNGWPSILGLAGNAAGIHLRACTCVGYLLRIGELKWVMFSFFFLV
jgi:hypothetical protein